MSCICTNAKNLPNCIDSLNIGYASANTDYNVCFKLPTGRIDVYPVTSDANGLITVEDGEWRIGDIYELWIALDTDNINAMHSFTVGGEAVSCLNIEFDYCNVSFAEQTIELV